MKEFLEYQKEIADIQYTINLLNWEFRIVSSVDGRKSLIDLISYHEKRLFELKSSEKYGYLLDKVCQSEEFEALSEEERRYIYNLRRHFENDKNIPSNFYQEYTKMKRQATLIWTQAKDENNYELFKPYLEKIIELTKKYYSYLSQNASCKNLYDIMLDQYERGITSVTIDKLFSELKEGIRDLIPEEKENESKQTYHYNDQQLIECAKYLLNYIGLDLNKIVLGIFPHGFTEKMCASDIRIAFKHSDNPIDFVSTIIHEGGHALFEQNIKDNLSKYENTTIDNLYALHESQSRFFENFLGRNINFWIPIYEDVKRFLELDYSLEEFVKMLNTPKLSFIRTEADELTYCMHIILRYEIERDLFAGNLNVNDLPNEWKQKTKEYLHIDVKNDSEGLMQDIHWAEGGFGYFPSYLLGSIYDGMLYEIVEKNIGNIDDLLKNGEIKQITQYLIDNIYINGGAYTYQEILDSLCGKELSAKPFIKYLNKKYGNKNV